MKSLKSQRGFSLIELMIVVAIIGILSAVAIPNFQKFQRKAKQSEAKSLLSAYYTAQKASKAELEYYPGNFPTVGFQPDGQLTYRIAVGDHATASPLNDATADACISTTGCTYAPGAAAYAIWAEKASAGAAGGAGCAGSSTDNAFLGCAHANLKDFGAAAAGNDTWSINESKILSNINSGL